MMKKMKSMSEEAAAVRRLVLLSDEDDELNVQGGIATAFDSKFWIVQL